MWKTLTKKWYSLIWRKKLFKNNIC